MFQITVKRDFAAFHALRNYKGQDEAPHRHIWRIEVTIEAPELDDAGCAADFVEVDECLNNLIEEMDCKTLNGLPYFEKISPSAENVARYLFERLAEVFDRNARSVKSVTVSEDPNHLATYFGDR